MSAMRNFNQTHKIFIVSAGRTATRFLGKKLGGIIPSCYSVHEPDLVSIRRSDEWFDQFAYQGLFRLVLLKLYGVAGSRNISLRRLSGKYDSIRSLRQLRKDREWLFKNFSARYYVESNYQLYGTVKELTKFPNSRVVLIVRHPVPWIRSWMNKGKSAWFNRNDFMARFGILGLRRLTPASIGQKSMPWKTFTQLEKLCWSWRFLNDLYIDAYRRGFPNLRLYRFEDLFEQREAASIADLIWFVTGGCERCNEAFSLFNREIDNKINSSYGNGLKWDFSESEETAVKTYCRELMSELGYE